MQSEGREWAFEYAFERDHHGWRWECAASPRFDSLEEAQRWVDGGGVIERGPDRVLGLPARTLDGARAFLW